jgi:GNAT superfamily N-acetyltransferase
MTDTVAAAGYRVRAPTLHDADAVVELVGAIEEAEFGEAEMTAGDLLAEWSRPGFRLDTDAWLVTAPDGMPAAYADVHYGRGRAFVSPSTGVHPDHTGIGIGSRLLGLLVERGTEMTHAATDDPTNRRCITHILGAANPFTDTLRRRGFEETKRHWTMRIDMQDRPATPRWPDGVGVRSFEPGRDDETIYRLVQTAFDDIEDREWSPYEEWRVYLIDRDDFDPGLWFVAEADGEIVGCALAVAYPTEGWIRQLAVRRDARGRGVGTALLEEAFGGLYDRGERRAGLGMAAANATAKRLYERAGMYVNQEFVEYDLRV